MTIHIPAHLVGLLVSLFVLALCLMWALGHRRGRREGLIESTQRLGRAFAAGKSAAFGEAWNGRRE